VQKGLESLAFIFALPHGDPFVQGVCTAGRTLH